MMMMVDHFIRFITIFFVSASLAEKWSFPSACCGNCDKNIKKNTKVLIKTNSQWLMISQNSQLMHSSTNFFKKLYKMGQV